MQYPTVLNYNKLAKFFDWKTVNIPFGVREKAKIARETHKKDRATEVDTFEFPDKKPLPISPKFRFLIGEQYSITDTKSKVAEENKEILTYVGKTGRHHQFKNVYGGWEISFTDSQLIGKVITGGKFHDNRTPWNE